MASELCSVGKLCLLLAVCLPTGLCGKPVAETPLGRVRGHWMTSRSGRRFLAFSGLPYAKPPVGHLRFEPPQRLEPWSGKKDATEDGPWCIQYNAFVEKPETIGVEDCLYLSVYSHNLTGRSAVLVHFHGGAFITGNGAKKTGPQYLMDEDLVIVDVNYRLSMFGFLSFEDEVMPGNQGMKDQVMALKWVQRNIASFGGDPNRVTIVGESAGGGSVYLHTVSPLSKGLIHAGIAESGTAYNPGVVLFPGAARNTSLWLLSLVGCSYSTTKEAVSCLKKKDAKELAEQIQNMRGWQGEVYAFLGPTLEPVHPGAFLTGPISHWKHSPVPLMIGTTSAEGLLKTLYMDYLNTSYEWYYNNFEEVAPRSLQVFGYSSEPDEVVKSVRKFYFPKGKITDKDWVNLTTMYSDSLFTTGIINGANSHTGNVYFYYFDYLGNYSLAGNAKTRNSSLYFGAFHMDEIIYLWYNKDFKNLKGKDLYMSERLVEMWAHFAKYWNPSIRGVRWLEWSPAIRNYLKISKDGFNMRENLAGERYRFWQSLKYRDNMI